MIRPALIRSALFTAALAHLGCTTVDASSLERTSQAIVGGTPTTTAQFPFAVAVLIGSQSACSGVLISPTVVLTAAHCIVAADAGSALVAIDTNDINQTMLGVLLPVQRVIPNPAYDDVSQAHDIGLLVLASAVTGHSPLALKTTTGGSLAGTSVTQVGFGSNDANQNGSGIERSIDKTVGDCTSITGGTPDNASALCFDQSDGKGTCAGDAGGPSFATISGVQTLVGIHSFGDQTCSSFGIDVRVDNELAFIGGVLCAADSACAAGCGTNALQADPDCTAGDGGGTGGSAGAGGGGTAGTAGTTSSGGTDAGVDSGNTPATGGTSGSGGTGAAGTTAAGATGAGGSSNGGTASQPDSGTTVAATGDDSGCGCRLAEPSRENSMSSWLALVAMLTVARRRPAIRSSSQCSARLKKSRL